MNRTGVTRRNLVLAGAASMAAASVAQAAMQCMPVAMGVNQCQVGLPSIAVQGAESQECQQWCWAACLSSIFAYYGVRVSQQRIVAKIFGGNICAPAFGPQIIAAARGAWTADNGQQFLADAQPLVDLQFGVYAPNAAAQAAKSLASGIPLINGALGHATVMTAMTYLADAYGRSQITAITVRDPWNPGGSSAIRRDLTAGEAASTQFLAQVIVR